MLLSPFAITNPGRLLWFAVKRRLRHRSNSVASVFVAQRHCQLSRQKIDDRSFQYQVVIIPTTMPYDHLSDFLSELQHEGELVRISAEVDADLELAAIVDRVCKSENSPVALLFENVRGHTVPIVANLLGSERRMCKALNADSFDQVAQRVAAAMQPEIPNGWLDAFRLVPGLVELTKLPPKIVDSAICQQVVKMGTDVKLSELPLPRCWPAETAPTITCGQVYSRYPDTEIRRVGLATIQVRDDSLAVQWTSHDEEMAILEEYRGRNQQMPVAIALGGDPILTYAATAPLPPKTDACLLAGFLRNRNVEMVQCRSVNLQVPAHAEFVIEGLIDTQAAFESVEPVAAPTGFYRPSEDVPMINVTALTHRSNPVMPVMILGRQPMEDFWLQKANERIFAPFVKLFVPEIVDFHMPRAGAFRNLLFVSIQKRYPQQAQKVMHALWGLGRLALSKLIVVVDSDVDVHNEEQVWFHVGANMHPGRDVVFSEGPTDMLDHAATVRGMGHKMGLDATRKLPEEGHPRNWPDRLNASDEIEQLVDRRWSDYGLDSP